MSHKTVITCDAEGCRNQQQVANHWFKFLYLIDGSVVVMPADCRSITDKDNVKETKDICGQECGAKELQGFMRGEK